MLIQIYINMSKKGETPTCEVCTQAVIPGNKNRRRNTGLIIRFPHPDGRPRVIMIDVGKV